jgi:hypothetical protein
MPVKMTHNGLAAGLRSFPVGDRPSFTSSAETASTISSERKGKRVAPRAVPKNKGQRQTLRQVLGHKRVALARQNRFWIPRDLPANRSTGQLRRRVE